MPLGRGTRIGPYEIVALLGAGGMGEVYRGHDPRLGRDVAIKIISGELVASAEQLRRFEQEARAAAALSHPNVLAIYDVGAENGAPYLVSEYLEGQTLRAVLNAGPVPFGRTLDLASQIAAGLAAAHARSIAHRDLKPENIFVTVDGLVKILDFGIAKWVQPPSASEAATIANPSATRDGAILGTMGYMAPEQAVGRAVDCRCDQFAFGIVVYEMLSGRRAFERPSHVEELAALVRDPPPPLADVRPEAPLPLQWILSRCLAKDPVERYDSTRDLHRDLETLATQMLHAPARVYAAAATESAAVPVPRTPLIGRETAVAAAMTVMLRDSVRLVTFTGPGGIGKTRLALQVVSELRDQFPGGVYFAPLSTIADPGLVPQAVAQACGLRRADAAPLELLRERFGAPAPPALLLLDSFEHLLDAVPLVVELLATAAPPKIAVTSREPLHLYEEHEVPVAPLPRPEVGAAVPLDLLARNAAVRLFVERAAASKPDFTLTSENARAIAEICNRLDGLPLAIELAAARTKTLPPAAMLGRMESRLQILTGGARDLPARQQTLRGAIAWSHDLLTEPEQRLFRRLAAFVGGCTFEAAEAVADTRQDLGVDVIDGLDSLVNKSLLQLTDPPSGEARLTMMETVREYSLERLAGSAEEAVVRKAHAAYFLVLAEEAAGGMEGPDQRTWLERLDADRDNLRAAADWLLRDGNADWGLRLASALLRYWEAREMFAEGRARLKAMLALPGAQAPSPARAKAVFAAGILTAAQRDYRAQLPLFDESLQIYRELGDTKGAAIVLNALAMFHRDQGDLAEARRVYEESCSLWRASGDTPMLARTLSNMASIVRAQGELDRAQEHHLESRALFAQLGDRTGAAWSLRHQADIARERQELPQAESLYLESLATFEELGDAWAAASLLTDLGNLALDRGDVAGAIRRFEDAAAAFGRHEGQRRGLARALEGLARAAGLDGRARDAVRLAASAATLRDAIGAPLTPAESLQLAAALEPAHRALDPVQRSAAWIEGAGMTAEQAVEAARPPGSAPASPLD